jgi:putative DNA primase/helicase
MSKRAPPAYSFGEYFLDNKGVLYKTKNGDILVMTGRVWIDEPVQCPSTGRLSYLIQIQPYLGKPSSIRIRPEDVTPRFLKRELGDRGIIVHEEKHLARYLSMTARFSDYSAKTPRTLIEGVGWFADGRGFHTGRGAITAKGVATSQYRFEDVVRPPFAVRGRLEGWKEHIGVNIERNPVLLGVACIFIASPFLRELGLGSRLVNIHGPKGTGKTLCSQCAATIFGNGTDPAAGLHSEHETYVTKFSTTPNGIEPLLARYSPLPIALDEMTEQSVGGVGELLYKMASGEGKHRATSQMIAAPVHRWQLTIVSTSERSVADAVGRTGKPLLGGQADRAIDIPIDRIRVISNFGDFADFQAITRHLKGASGQHYGSAGESILQYAVDHPEEIKRLCGTIHAIEERLVPPNCGAGERRVVKFLAAAVVAGHIAMAAKVFDCEADKIEAAVKVLVDEWWHGRGGSLRRIAEFLHANEPDISTEAPTRHSSAKAFIHGDWVIIPDYVFEAEFEGEVNEVINELRGLDALPDREQTKRNKHRFCNNRMFAYVVLWDRVAPILQELAERDDAKNAEALSDSRSQLEKEMI